MAYASQEAWVFSATLRDNILFGLPYDPKKYDAVLEACALTKVVYICVCVFATVLMVRIWNCYLKVT